MATASFTSEWEWVTITRTQDVNVDADDPRIKSVRNNWVLIRKRYTNRTYESQLGQEVPILRGYNGGVKEIFSAPREEGVKFVSIEPAATWVTEDDFFQKTGETQNGFPVYANYDDQLGNGNYEILYLINYGGLQGYKWVIQESTAGTYATKTGNISYSNIDATQDAPASIDGVIYTGVAANPPYNTGAATAALTKKIILNMYCSSDVQSYDTQWVDWYTQTQTWIYKDNFTNV